MSTILKRIILIIAIVLCVFILIIIIPNIATMDRGKKHAQLMTNMHNIQMAAENFSLENRFCLFPVDTLTYTNEIDPKSTTRNTLMTLLRKQIAGFNQLFENPYSKDVPPLILVLDTLELNNKAQPGQVIYNPILLADKGAKGYRIFGKDNKRIISLVFTSDTTAAATNK